jgi:hypothetical protein
MTVIFCRQHEVTTQKEERNVTFIGRWKESQFAKRHAPPNVLFKIRALIVTAESTSDLILNPVDSQFHFSSSSILRTRKQLLAEAGRLLNDAAYALVVNVQLLLS